MRVRHKQPTLVSMWMLDVFCCALGCVTLLFLFNSRMASDEAAANRTALIDLRTTERSLAAALAELERLRLRLNSESQEREKLAAALSQAEGVKLKLTDEVRELNARLAAATTETAELTKKLAQARQEAKAAKALAEATQQALNAAEAKAQSTAQELAAARGRAAEADEVLRKKHKEVEALARKLSEMTAAADELSRLLRKRDDEKVLLVKQTVDLQKQLDDLDGRLAASLKELDDARKAAKLAAARAAEELAASRAKAGEELRAAQDRVKDLLQQLNDANATIVDLQGDKAKLADKLDKLQKETEARFAGIVTSGKRVVFLIDISGSMAKRDARTADPNKWPLVVETVGKVMRSVAGLEKYQVVIFSSSARFLFGSGDWLDYLGQKSIDAVTKALLEVTPYDDTNLYAGFEKAFSLRETGGLDTIYLFSDGLPTSGPGLTLAEQTRQPPLSEIELGERLGRHLRRTLKEVWNRPLPNRPPVRIHAVGFYFDSPDLGAFLWSLARENDGSFVGMSKP